MARRQKRAYSSPARMMTRARLVALLTCLCFLPSGSAVAQTGHLYGSDGAGGNLGDLVILDPATGAVTRR